MDTARDPDSDPDTLPQSNSNPTKPKAKPKQESKPNEKRKPLPTFEVLQSTKVVQTGANTGLNFFDFPPEVRNLIYGQVAQLRITECGECYEEDNQQMSGQERRQRWGGWDGIYDSSGKLLCNNGPFLNLVRTSKQTYLETLHLLYADMGFEYMNIYTVHRLLDRIGPNGRACIRSLSQTGFVDHSFEQQLPFKRDPIAYELRSLSKLRVFMDKAHYRLKKSGDEMHPICSLRGAVLEVFPSCRLIYDNFESEWYKVHKEECEAYHTKMITHVAQPYAA